MDGRRRRKQIAKGATPLGIQAPLGAKTNHSFLPSHHIKPSHIISGKSQETPKKDKKEKKKKEHFLPRVSCHNEPPRITLTFAILGIVGNSLFSGTLPRLGRNGPPPAAVCRPRSSLRRRRREDPVRNPTLHQQLRPSSRNSSLSVDQLVAAKMMAFHRPCSGRTMAPARLSA